MPVTPYVDSFGNTCGRIVAMAGRVRFRNDAVVYDDGQPDAHDPSARQHLIDELPADVLQFLLSSRYCEVDRLKDVAWGLFSKAAVGYERVQAICDWVHENVTFGYGFASETKSAADVYRERKGVCRDFTHLAIAFCRCMNVPARYATGYMGEIGVPPAPPGGFQRLVRGVPGRALVDAGCPAQYPAHRPGADGPRAGRDKRRPDHRLRRRRAEAVHRLDG